MKLLPRPTRLALCLLAAAGAASAQVVLRWGDGAVDAPAGARVVRHAWGDASPDRGGELYQVRVDGGLRPIGLDPRVDLAPLAPSQGGGWNDRRVIFDHDRSTTWRDDGYTCLSLRTGCDDIYASPGTNELDLGADYLIDRVVLVSGLDDPALTVRDFRVHVGPLPNLFWCCDPMHPVAVEVRDNREQIREVGLPGAARTRFLQIAVGEREEGWEIHDVEVYGQGFVDRGRFTSDVVDLGRPLAWGRLRWSGRQGQDARVLIQTRSGTDRDPERHWRYTGRGAEKEEVTREGYADLAVGERAGTTHDFAAWSPWSAPYDFADSAGVPVVSPAPRRYLQLKVDFLPGETGGELRDLELRAWPPAASALVGEVWPAQAPAGEWRDFTWALRPTIGPADTGFDRLELRSESFLGPVDEVRVGDVAVAWEAIVAEPHRLVLRLPALDAKDSGTLVEVDLRAQVLRYGTRFDGRVWRGDGELASQGVDPGNASLDLESDRLSVATSSSSRSLLRLGVAPGVLTPNGDGRNDTALLECEVFEITDPGSVRLEVLDLAGRRVRLVAEAPLGIGRYGYTWDGRDDGGRLVPAGLYAVRATLTTDGLRERRLRALAVAH